MKKRRRKKKKGNTVKRVDTAAGAVWVGVGK
jgi:hypothetical protein